MLFLLMSAKFPLNVSIGFHDMIILIMVRCQYELKVKSICSDSGLNTVRVACRKIDITLKCNFDRVSIIYIVLKQVNIFTQNLDSIWQKAICTRPYTLI